MSGRIIAVAVTAALASSLVATPAQAGKVTCPPKLTKAQLTKALGKKWYGGTKCDSYAMWNMGVGSAVFGVRYYVPRKAKYTVSVGASIRVDPTIDVWSMFSEDASVLQRTDTSLLLQTSDGTFGALRLLPSGKYVMVYDAKSQTMATKLMSYQIKRLG